MAEADAKVKQEKPEDVEDQPEVSGGMDDMKKEEKIKDEKKVKGEKTEAGESVKGEDGVKGEGVKGEGVKGEGVKGEGVKGEGVKGEGVKGENLKKEGVKNEGSKVKQEVEGVKGEGVKGEGVKGEGVKGEGVKGEGAKKEGTKGELAVKGEVKGEGVKNQVKTERSRSPKKKKDKKDKKDKVKREQVDGEDGKKEKKKDKKRKRSRSGEARKRKSKWGPDVPAGFSMTAIPGGRSGLMSLPGSEENIPRFNDEEMKIRTLILENLPNHVTGQELIEFFNGAVLAVTANAVQQAANKSMAPVYACTVTESDHGGGDKRKAAELKFRTPDGASVGMKLNGIEYRGGKVKIRRTQGFPFPQDGQDPASKLNLHEMSMARLVGVSPGSAKAQEGPLPKLSIFNLPDVMSEQIVRDLLSQFGKLRMMSLIRDLATGKIKGYGIFEYDDPGDVDLAVLALNGFVCGQNVIRVQKLGAQAATAQPKAQPVAATAMANSMTQKIVSNPVLAMQVKQGREVGSRPSPVVQLLNAVYQEDLMDDQDYDDIMSEVHNMASKHGTVSRVVIPKPAKDGSYVDGVGKIFIAFQDLTAARRFQMDANGRKFEQRVVCAAFYPMEKFNEGKFKLWSA